MEKKIYLCFLALSVLLGCDRQALLEKFVPKEEAAFSRNYLALFQSRDFDAIEAKVDPRLKDQQLRMKLEQVAALFPSEKPNDIKIVGVQTLTNGDVWRANLTFQYEFSKQWLLANVTLMRLNNDLLVTGVNVQPLDDSLAKINRFTFENKGAVNYGIFILAVVVPLFIVFALVICAKTPIPKRKWLWMVFILLGFMQISVNWTSGGVNINPFYFQLLGAGFWKSGFYGPLVISASIPVGAIVFLLRRNKWLHLSSTTQGDHGSIGQTVNSRD